MVRVRSRESTEGCRNVSTVANDLLKGLKGVVSCLWFVWNWFGRLHGDSRWGLRRSKLVISLILVCVSVALFSLPQFASSQSVTTMSAVQTVGSTSVVTLTSTLLSTVLAPQPVHYDLTPLDFNNETGTFTLGYSEIGTAPYYPENSVCLMYDYFLLNATTAYEFRIHFDTQQNLPVGFFILNMDQLNQFNHTNCAKGFSDWELRVVAPASDLVWAVPQRAEYALLFLSVEFVGGYVRLMVQAFGQATQISASAYTSTSIVEILSTQTVFSTMPSTVQTSTGQAATGYSGLIDGVVIVVVALLAVGIIFGMKKSRAR